SRGRGNASRRVMSAPWPTVLVIEDEPQMRRFLRATLENHEYRMVDAPTAQQALAEAATRSPDIVLLDLGLPDIDGIEVLERLREGTQVPGMVVWARDHEEQKIRALEAGADDSLTKPFGAGELLARIRVALRHADRKRGGADEPVFKVDDLEV